MRIEITRKESNITRRWTFTYFSERDFTLYLEEYRLTMPVEGKRTQRVIEQYNRLMTRDNTLTVENVPLPDDVKNEALKTFTDQIKVEKWLKK